MSKCLYFIHIVKTGGSSLRGFFRHNNISLDFNTGDNFGHDSYSEETVKILKERYRCVSTAICLRDPVSQLASFYSYIQLNPTTEIYKTIGTKSFSEWIRSVPNFNNYYVRFLNYKGCYNPNLINNLDNTPCNYDNAVSILNSIDYVIDTSLLSRSFNRLLYEHYIDIEFNHNDNPSKSDEIMISDEDIRYIKEIRAMDYDLLRQFNIRIQY